MMRPVGDVRLTALRLAAALALGGAATMTAPARLPGQEAISVERPDGSVRTYTTGQLAALSSDTLRVSTGHGAPPATFQVIPLGRLLSHAGVALDSLGGRDLLQLVVAEARDGYAVAFSLGELSPTLGNREVAVAFTRDARAIPPTDGPFRLLVPGEARAARAVRQLVRLRVLRVDPAARAGQRSQRPSPSATKSSSRSHG
ncbi:MAG: hypothetical protein IPF98_08395 [Gemmatimonadetes bacterium]|nr:hypothetical protein [Gemmatimonadota bacterium]MCC6773680.1 hypothetical protein [Gemmatimonadaceae bacterium]